MSLANVLVPIFAPVSPILRLFGPNSIMLISAILFQLARDASTFPASFIIETLNLPWVCRPQRVVHSVVANRVLLLIFKQKSASNMTNRVPRRGQAGGGTEMPYFRSYEDEGYSANLTIRSPHSLGIPSSNTAPSQVQVDSIIEVNPTERETVITRYEGAFAY